METCQVRFDRIGSFEKNDRFGLGVSLATAFELVSTSEDVRGKPPTMDTGLESQTVARVMTLKDASSPSTRLLLPNKENHC